MPTIRGKVIDPQGSPVAQAAVYVVSSPVSMRDIAQLTDDRGQFIISVPVAGLYKIGVREDKWGLAQREVDVQGEGPASIEVRFKTP